MRVHRVPKAGETVIGWDFQEPKDGGKGSNQAIAAARLGGSVSFIGCVGCDRIGEEGEKWMLESGVDTTWLKHHERTPSGVGFILLEESGVPAMVTSMGANAEIRPEDIAAAFVEMPDAEILLTQFEIDPETALYAARLAKEQGKIAIVNPAPAPEKPISGLGAASILVPNETEAQVLLGLTPGERSDPLQMALDLKAKTGVPVVMITLGSKGIIGADDQGTWQVAAPTVTAVDTSGAGDVFCAALAVALTNGMDVRQASDWACKAASLSVTKEGTIPAFPTLEEMEEFVAAREAPPKTGVL